MMENIAELLKSNIFILIQFVVVIGLIVGVIVLLKKYYELNKRYNDFMEKVGNGKNIEEDLENYIHRVDRVEKQNAEIMDNINTIEKDMENCIQKVGIVRYNAFKDTGSDLSFALAFLDENNNGVVLNGIYSRDTSNVFAKNIDKGSSKYVLSNEEKQALEKAMQK